MTKNDYQGLVDSAKQLHGLGKKLYNAAHTSLPDDLAELKRIKAGIIQEEKERLERNQLKADIKRLKKENFRKRKLERRTRIKKILHLRQKP